MEESSSSDAGFWERAATWKAVLFVVAYLAFYLAAGQVVDRVFAGRIDSDDDSSRGTLSPRTVGAVMTHTLVVVGSSWLAARGPSG